MAELRFKLGDKVLVNGIMYQSANGTLTKKTVKNQKSVITRVAEKGAHPYAVDNVYGWFNEGSLKKLPEITVKVGDKVKVLNPMSYNGNRITLRYADYTITSLDDDKAVITHNHAQTLTVNAVNLQKI